MSEIPVNSTSHFWNDGSCLRQYKLNILVNDYCLTPNGFILAISWREHVSFGWDDDMIIGIRPTHLN